MKTRENRVNKRNEIKQEKTTKTRENRTNNRNERKQEKTG